MVKNDTFAIIQGISLARTLFRSFTYLLLSFLCVNPLFSQQLFLENGSPSHPQVLGYASQTRSVIDLSGEWEFSLDEGVTWASVRIPAAAQYEGKIVYKRKFAADEELIGRSAFRFVSYGINHTADVFINDLFIGRHAGGYTSFELPVPENAVQSGGENVIRIVTDNSLDHRTTFPLRAQVNGVRNYGGLTRDLFLVAVPRASIASAGVTVDAIEPKGVRLTVSAELTADGRLREPLSGRSLQLTVSVASASTGALFGKPVTVPVDPLAEGKQTAEVPVTLSGLTMWSPDTPELITVTLSLAALEGKKDSLLDETAVTTGVRTFTKDKEQLLLNGAPVTLRGVVWFEDSERHGSAMTYEEMERDVALIRNLGANTVRAALNPPHPFFVQLCDRYGLFVLEEVPNDGIPAAVASSEGYREQIEERLRAMVQRDRHRPSVIAWGLGSGSAATADGVPLLKALHRTAKALDGRLTYSVSGDGEHRGVDAADIAGIDLSGDDTKRFRSRLTEFKRIFAGTPVLVAGYGLAVEKGNHNGYSDPVSEEAQARHLHQRTALLRELGAAGGIIRAFNDHRSDRPVMRLGPASSDLHTSGIVALDRQKKTAYDVMHSLYHGQKVSALPMGVYVPPSPYLYVIIGLALLVTAAWLINGNRRYRESTWRSVFKSYNFFADIRDQFSLPLFHTTVTAVIIAVTIAVTVSSVLHHYRTDALADYLLSFFLADAVKRLLIAMAWDPVTSILYLSGAMMAWFFLLTFLIQVGARVARTKVRLFHSYSIAVWTAMPWIAFIPVGMILYRVLQSDAYVPWIVGLIGMMSLWTFFRMLKGISVIYHMYTPKMYMLGLTAVVVLLGGGYLYADAVLSVTAYADLFFSSVLPFAH